MIAPFLTKVGLVITTLAWMETTQSRSVTVLRSDNNSKTHMMVRDGQTFLYKVASPTADDQPVNSWLC